MGLIKYSKHAPLKKKFIKGNQAPFMNRKLEKEIGIRSKLRNNCWRELLATNKIAYKKHRKKCFKIRKKEEEDLIN